MGRIKLTSMLDEAKDSLQPSPAAESASTSHRRSASGEGVSQAPALAAAPPENAPPANPRGDAPTGSSEPAGNPRERKRSAPAPTRFHYASLVRKEARLRDDQIESLTLRARKLSRSKTGSDERITDNTLIRIAVDLLLARQSDLAGNSEAELRKSVGL